MRAPYSRNLFDLIDEQAGRYPGHAAVIAGGVELSYAELAARALKVAGALRAVAVHPSCLGRGTRGPSVWSWCAST